MQFALDDVGIAYSHLGCTRETHSPPDPTRSSQRGRPESPQRPDWRAMMISSTLEFFATSLRGGSLKPLSGRTPKPLTRRESGENLNDVRRTSGVAVHALLVIAFYSIGLLPMAVHAQSEPSKITIPFEVTQGRVYVEAFVNERGPFRFMVDTGASGIGRADVRLIKELALPITGTASNSDSVNTATVETAAIKSLRIGQLTRHNVEVFSRDYNSKAAPDAKTLMGIIGREFFSDHLLTIDYKKNELALCKGSLKSSDANVLHYEADSTLVVPFRIGQYDAVGLIDTGSSLEMHLPLSWAEKLKIQTLKDAGQGRRANTVFKLSSAELPVPVRIGGSEIAVMEAHFSELATRIHIGGVFLTKNQCVVTLDQKNQLVRMRCAQK